MDTEASRHVVHQPAELGEVADEMADVACYLLAMASTLGIDLSTAILGKLEKNAQKYPVEKCKGRYRV
jgi:dCTP diphosphatase